MYLGARHGPAYFRDEPPCGPEWRSQGTSRPLFLAATPFRIAGTISGCVAPEAASVRRGSRRNVDRNSIQGPDKNSRTAQEAAETLKRLNPTSKVAVRDLRTNEQTLSNTSCP